MTYKLQNCVFMPSVSHLDTELPASVISCLLAHNTIGDLQNIFQQFKYNASIYNSNLLTRYKIDIIYLTKDS